MHQAAVHDERRMHRTIAPSSGCTMRAHCVRAHGGRMRSHVTSIILVFNLSMALSMFSLCIASTALAFSPEEADAMSTVVGHPLPSYVITPIVADDDGDAPPTTVFAPGGPPLPIYLNGEG